MDREERQRRGQHAARLLADPLLAEAFAALEAQYINEWRRSGWLAFRRRDRSWLALRALDQVRANLTAIVNDGKLAADRPRR